MFQRRLIFLEFVSSIVNPVNKLYSLAYKVQQTFFVPAIKTWISEQHDTSFLLTKYYSYWNVFYLVKMRNLSLVSIWSLRSLWWLLLLRKKSSAIAAIIAIIRKALCSDRRYKKFYLSDRCRCDRWKLVSILSLCWLRSLNPFFLSAIKAIVAMIWKPGFK